MLATEVEDNILTAPTVTGLDTLVINAISYMVDLPVLLIWLSLLIISEFKFCLRELIDTLEFKSSSVTSVAQTGNISASLTFICILDP